MTTADWAVRVPASSANLGAGFDVLGMALTLHAHVGCGAPPPGALVADEHHPATTAFRRTGGEGELWVRSPIPMGRGMGYSGAVRVGGAACALVQREGRAALDDLDPAAGHLDPVLDLCGELEGHLDNAAASLFGGVVVTAGRTVRRLPLALDPAVVVWVPDASSTSTDRSRFALQPTVARSDAVFNLGRVGLLVAALATGDTAALRITTEDRLHQVARLAEVPRTAAALDAARDAGAWATWLSGSGPSVAALCETGRAEEIAAALPDDGHTKLLHIDHAGATVTLVDDAIDDDGDVADDAAEPGGDDGASSPAAR